MPAYLQEYPMSIVRLAINENLSISYLKVLKKKYLI